MARTQRVVVVGGGVGGHRVARALSKLAHVTVIDPRDHLMVPMAGPRMLVEPRLAERALIPFSEALPGVEVVRGRATALRQGAVAVQPTDEAGAPINGEINVMYDIVVLATGMRWPEPTVVGPGQSKHTRAALLKEHARAVAEARHILIVGGGPVGVEVAGELATDRPGLAVTVVHSRERLLPAADPRVSAAALDWLCDHGVEVILGQRAHQTDTGWTAGDRTLRPDLVIRATGARPRTEWLQGVPGLLDEHGFIEVDAHLRTPARPHTWAVGDAVALPERKMAMYATKHADVVAGGIRQVLRGRPDRLPRWTPRTHDHTALVTLGRRSGVGHVPVLGPLTWGWLAARLKSEGVFVGMFRRRVGLR